MTDNDTTIPFTEADYQRVRLELEKRRLALYRPYPKQMAFHKAGKTYRERLLRAGNQCISPWTFIQRTDGTTARSGDIFFEKDANVLSWDGESECASKISHGFLKGIGPAFRLVMESGRFFDCSSSHQILTESGYLRIDQIMSRLDGLYLSHKAEDYQASCVVYGYLYGRPLQWEEDSGQESLPSSNDVPTHTLSFSHEGAMARIHQYTTTWKESDPRSIFECGPLQRESLYDLFAAASVNKDALSLSNEHYKIRRLASVIGDQSRSSGESFVLREEDLHHLQPSEIFRAAANTLELRVSSHQFSQQFLCVRNPGYLIELSSHDASRRLIFYPYETPVLVGGERVAAIVEIGYQPIIDCQVPGVNNYKSAGVYHHNCGKTMAAAAEVAMHATGRYPSWWGGRVYKKAPVIWCGGITGEVTRDTVQRLLIGDEANPGGFIMQDDIVETTPSRGVADLKDTIFVKHASGGTSRIRLKYYEQGREKWQGDTVDLVWFDEEPPIDLYMEGLTRTNATGGVVMMTFTPLKGMSETVRRFLVDSSVDRSDTNMTIMDALHIPEAERRKIIESYPIHEREARLNGTPMLGSGRIFPVAEADITCRAFAQGDMPWYWMEIAGIDFGWDHPTAAVKLLYDPQGDVVYVTQCYKRREATPLLHAAALRGWGKELNWAWPHDGLQHDKGSGVQLKEQYAREGLKMLGERATFDDERSNGKEAVIAEVLMRMESGRFKVFAHLTEFFEEFRLYHRKDGKVVAEYDDILCACFYAVMMLRYATPINPPAAAMKNGGSGLFKSAYNPLGVDYIKKLLGERNGRQ